MVTFESREGNNGMRWAVVLRGREDEAVVTIEPKRCEGTLSDTNQFKTRFMGWKKTCELARIGDKFSGNSESSLTRAKPQVDNSE